MTRAEAIQEWLHMMQQAHHDWMRAVRKTGPNSKEAGARRRELEMFLMASAPRAPKMEGRA